MVRFYSLSSSQAFLILAWAGLGLWLFLLFVQQTNLAASDLGRHVTNGRLILESGTIFQNNLYSYTNPAFSAPNHHWLFGVVVQLLHQVGGFPLITLAIAGVYWVGCGLALFFAKRVAGHWPTLISAIGLLPLVAMRTETRPDAFTVLGLSLWLLSCDWLWVERTRLKQWLAVAAAALVVVIWVNVHILFIVSFLVTGSYLLVTFISRDWQRFFKYLQLLVAQLSASLLNPFSWRTVLYPFQIFTNYQYPVAENQSLSFFMRYHFSTEYSYLTVLLSVLFIGGGLTYAAIPRRFKPIWLTAGALAVGTALITRTSSLLLIPSFIVGAQILAAIRQHQVWQHFFNPGWARQTEKLFLVVVTCLVSLGLLLAVALPQRGNFGLGLTPGVEAAGDFFLNQQLPGPIFNNYDIGGYLIYKLYPHHHVFVDNRPEAYPGNFLKNDYIAAQEQETSWQALVERYGFQTIFFYRHDATDWAQPFLARRLKDPEWTPVYVDGYSIILLKNSEENQELVDKLRLPPGIITVAE